MARLILIFDTFVFLLLWYVDDFLGVWFLIALLHFCGFMAARPLPGYERADPRQRDPS